MHFALVLLFCLLIRVSNSTNTNEENPENFDVRPAESKDDVRELEPGRIVGVLPNDFFKGGGTNTKRHAAVFVGINGNTVQVVVISRNFVEHFVPRHLRGSVNKYFDYPTLFNILGHEAPLAGDLDLSMFRELKWKRILIAYSGKPTIMAPDRFEDMVKKIGSNKANMGIKPLDWEPEELASTQLKDKKGKSKEIQSGKVAPVPAISENDRKLASIQQGEIIRARPWQRHPNVYLGIFVSWVGDGRLAVVLISYGLKNVRKQGDITHYKVKDKNGKLVDLHGKISLEGYQMVHFSGITFDGTDKRVMEKTSYMELRQAIDHSLKEKLNAGRLKADDENDKIGIPQGGRGRAS